MAKQQQINLEDSIRTLEDLVKQLEQGDLSLEESLKTFEAGITLTRECHQQLDRAEQKINLLVGAGEDLQLVAFDDGAEKTMDK